MTVASGIELLARPDWPASDTTDGSYVFLEGPSVVWSTDGGAGRSARVEYIPGDYAEGYGISVEVPPQGCAELVNLSLSEAIALTGALSRLIDQGLRAARSGNARQAADARALLRRARQVEAVMASFEAEAA